MTMDHLLYCSLINDNVARLKERMHVAKFIKRYPTFPDTAPYVISYIARVTFFSNFNILLLFP